MRLACSLLVAVIAAAVPLHALAQEHHPWVALEWGEFQPHFDRVNRHGVVGYKFRRVQRNEQGARVHYYEVHNPNDVPVRIHFSPAASLRALVSVAGDQDGETRYDTRNGQRPPAEFDLEPGARFAMRIELDPEEVAEPARGLRYWTRPIDSGSTEIATRGNRWAGQIDAALTGLLQTKETNPTGELDELVEEIDRARAVPPGEDGGQ